MAASITLHKHSKKKPNKNLKSIFMHMHKTKQNHTGRTHHNTNSDYLHAVDPAMFLSVSLLHFRFYPVP